MNWNRRGSLLLIVGVSLALIAVFTPHAQPQLIVSPALGDGAQVYDAAELRELALQRAAVLGFEGTFETEQAYLITLGQWLTLTDSDVGLTGGLTRETPVYVLQGTGQFTTFGQPAYDHVTIAVGLEREDMLWIHYSPPDAPKLIIDTTVEDVPLNLTPPVSSLMRVTQTAEAPVAAPDAQHQLIVSPVLEDGAEVYDVAELRELALKRAAILGFEGTFETEQSYLITLGQWLTLRRSDVRLTGGLTRETPVYVLQGTGHFTTFGQPAFDHVTIAVGLEREDMLWIHYSPPDAPKLIIDTTVEDVQLNLTQPVSSLMRATQTAEASSSGGEAP